MVCLDCKVSNKKQNEKYFKDLYLKHCGEFSRYANSIMNNGLFREFEINEIE